MTSPIVIIGTGQSGAKAAEVLRQKGYDGDLVMVGDEPFLPYQRPPLSKAYLKGETDEERLSLRPQAFFEAAAIDLRTSTRAIAIDPAARTISLQDGSSLTYAQLLLATGTRARTIPVPGAGLKGVFTLRTLADVAALKGPLEEAEDVAILGGGYIGMEFAAVAAGLGKTVTVVEARKRVMERSVAPLVSGHFQSLHSNNGVSLLLGRSVREISGDAAVSALLLDDGSSIAADLVLMAVGAEPVTELAAAAGLEVTGGIRVDEVARTSLPGIFAAGDCTIFPSRRFGREIRLESVQNAIDQAKIAAGSMLGETAVYDPVPWFWSDQYDTKLQIAGLSEGYDRTELEGDSACGSFVLRYFRNGGLIAVDTVNAPREHMLARRELQQLSPEFARHAAAE